MSRFDNGLNTIRDMMPTHWSALWVGGTAVGAVLLMGVVSSLALHHPHGAAIDADAKEADYMHRLALQHPIQTPSRSKVVKAKSIPQNHHVMKVARKIPTRVFAKNWSQKKTARVAKASKGMKRVGQRQVHLPTRLPAKVASVHMKSRPTSRSRGERVVSYNSEP